MILFLIIYFKFSELQHFSFVRHVYPPDNVLVTWSPPHVFSYFSILPALGATPQPSASLSDLLLVPFLLSHPSDESLLSSSTICGSGESGESSRPCRDLWLQIRFPFALAASRCLMSRKVIFTFISAEALQWPSFLKACVSISYECVAAQPHQEMTDHINIRFRFMQAFVLMSHSFHSNSWRLLWWSKVSRVYGRSLQSQRYRLVTPLYSSNDDFFFLYFRTKRIESRGPGRWLP